MMVLFSKSCVLVGLWLALSSAILPAKAIASTNEGEYSVYFADVPLGLALDVIGRDLGVEFALESSQRLRVRDLALSGTPDKVVSELFREIGMDAFQFNGQVFVSATDTREVRFIRLGQLTPKRAIAALEAAGLLIPDFEINEVADGKAVVLSGPVKYLAISESVIASLDAEPATAQSAVRIRKGGILESDRVGLSAEAATE